MSRLPVLLLVLAVAAAGCGDDDTTVASGDPTASTPPTVAAETRYEASGTVLESPDHGPQLCSNLDESYPPQCSGPEIVGWDWVAAEGAESANGTTWGYYTVVGIWDGEALTLTEPPRIPDRADQGADDEDRFTTPCPAPEGGWHVVDEATATEAAMSEAIAHARSQSDVGGVWLDQSVNPAANQEPIDEWAMNDPRRLVLNLSFTGDLEQHETAVREMWGGALCVSEAPISAAQLAEIRAEIEGDVGRDVGQFVSSGIDESMGRIEIGVVLDDGLQVQFDERYGVGVVEVHSVLQPVEE